VLAFGEVQTEPHNTERDTFYEVNGALQPRPAPRFSRTAPGTPRPAEPATDVEALLRDWV
jgi:alpha-methylacyl-CoA racemase